MARTTRNTETSTPQQSHRLVFWLRLLGISLLCALVGWLGQSLLFSVDAAFYDAGVTSVPDRPTEDIVILGIDEQFMAGRHPYLAPRDRLAELINIAVDGKPRVIIVDVFLDSRIDRNPNGVDSQLRRALLNARQKNVPVILSDIPPVDSSPQGQFIGITTRGSVRPYFRDVALTGNILMDLDPDGVVRSLPRSSALPALPLLAASKARPKYNWDDIIRRSKAHNIPLDFRGPAGTFAVTPAYALLEQPFGNILLQDKIVLIGATYKGIRDVMRTPYSTRLQGSGAKPSYGVEMLATATQTLLDGAPRHSHESPAARLQDFLAAWFAALAALVLGRRGVMAGIVAALGAVLLSGLLAFVSAKVAGQSNWLSTALGHRFHPAAPFWIAAPLAAALGVGWKQLEQARELKQVRDAFGAYVGEEVLESLGGNMPELGGEVRPIAVLFCDIRGYSALAERMKDDPKALMAELNEHFHPLVNALKLQGAYVDNYVGDLVMALFGAPAGGQLSDVAPRAARAALDFVEVVNERNARRIAQGLPAIEIGVGVHCGDAVVGNLGTLDREGGSKIHYTAIGDTVNLASRVESSTRKYEVPLLVTEEMVEACQTDNSNKSVILPDWEFVAETTVKGRETPVRLYRPKN